MTRRTRVYRERVVPDAKYKSTLVSMLVNRILIKGKKSVAEKIVYDSFENIAEKTGKPALEVYEAALQNVMPIMEVKSRRVGGSTYQVPVEVRKKRRISLALRWLVGFARNRNGKSMVEKLTNELLDAYNKTGATIKKREDTHKMAEANKAFAHFKW